MSMTNTDALALEPGDRIRLRPQPTWSTNPPGRTVFTVANAAQRAPDFRAGYSAVRILSVDGFRFTPWEVERDERERRP